MATADGVAFGKSGEPEHRHVNARCLAGDDRRQHLAQPRAELESVAGKSCRDVQAANTVDCPKDGLPVRSNVVQTRVPAPDLRVLGSRVPAGHIWPTRSTKSRSTPRSNASGDTICSASSSSTPASTVFP